jgi:hypothetical protein
MKLILGYLLGLLTATFTVLAYITDDKSGVLAFYAVAFWLASISAISLELLDKWNKE